MKTNTDSELVRFAKVELDRLLKNTEPGTDEYTMQKAANDDILDVIKVFAGHGDSGFSAAYKLSILEDLLRFSPVSPLTGDGDEWNEVGALSDDGKKTVYQNRRCSSVFMNVDKTTGDVEAEYIDKYRMSADGGLTWFTPDEHKLNLIGLTRRIDFPFTVHKPIPIYIKYDVSLGENPDNFTVLNYAAAEDRHDSHL